MQEGAEGVFILYHSGAKDYRLTKRWGIIRRLKIYVYDGTTLCHNISRTLRLIDWIDQRADSVGNLVKIQKRGKQSKQITIHFKGFNEMFSVKRTANLWAHLTTSKYNTQLQNNIPNLKKGRHLLLMFFSKFKTNIFRRPTLSDCPILLLVLFYSNFRLADSRDN